MLSAALRSTLLLKCALPVGAVASVAALTLLVGASASHGQNAPATSANATLATAATRVPVTFSGGHDTDPRDRGRPVVLVAGALGVSSEVFREAFSHVHPAGPGSGGPTRAEAQQNKAALMSALGKYGITNDRLDEVSNRYRYVRSEGQMWPTKPAEAYAVVEKGVVTRFVVTDGGSGYSSVPTMTVAGVEKPKTYIQLTVSKDFEKNGSIVAITIPKEKAK